MCSEKIRVMYIPKNKKLIKASFYLIFAFYFIYLLFYSSNSYNIINNIDLIANILWIVIGVLVGFIIFYSIWLKKQNLLNKKSFILNLFLALLLFLLFKVFPLIVAFIDFAINGWG